MRIIILTVLLIPLSACSMQAGKGAFSQEAGRILIDADEKGMRALGDMFTGAITTGKASPDKTTAHHQLRNKQAVVELKKHVAQYTSESFGGADHE